MTCYSPLLGLSQGIVSSLTYSGHTLNQRTAGELHSQILNVDLAALWHPGGRLDLPRSDSAAGGGDLTVTSSDYGLQPGELLVGVPLARLEVPDPSDPLLSCLSAAFPIP
jgi:hypothetical protein